jgi:hypothetical protein
MLLILMHILRLAQGEVKLAHGRRHKAKSLIRGKFWKKMWINTLPSLMERT